METLGIIFGSTVFAALISGIVAVATARKQDSLHYITAERKEWRREIRKIVSKHQGATHDNTLKILTPTQGQN